MKNLSRAICAVGFLSLSQLALADGVDQVWVCGIYGYEGAPQVKVDFKNFKACTTPPSPASELSDYCKEDASVSLNMLGTWPETVSISGTSYRTTLVGLRNQNKWMTIRFFSGLNPSGIHADFQGNVILPTTKSTTNPYASFATGDGYCRRVH